MSSSKNLIMSTFVFDHSIDFWVISWRIQQSNSTHKDVWMNSSSDGGSMQNANIYYIPWCVDKHAMEQTLS